MAAKRAQHVVRISSPQSDDKTQATWVEVTVLDGFSLISFNGWQQLLEAPASGCQPFIMDTTPKTDHGTTGSKNACSRVSKLENVVSQTSNFDFEILLGVACVQPQSAHFLGHPHPTKGEFLLLMPEKEYVAAVAVGPNDDVSSPVGVTDKTTRLVVTNKLMNGYEPNANPETYLIVHRLIGVIYQGPNGIENGFILPEPDKSEILDHTNYTTVTLQDGTFIDKVPPENKDPNPYVVWPKDGSGDPFLSDPAFPAKQGLLWYISRIVEAAAHEWTATAFVSAFTNWVGAIDTPWTINVDNGVSSAQILGGTGSPATLSDPDGIVGSFDTSGDGSTGGFTTSVEDSHTDFTPSAAVNAVIVISLSDGTIINAAIHATATGVTSGRPGGDVEVTDAPPVFGIGGDSLFTTGTVTGTATASLGGATASVTVEGS